VSVYERARLLNNEWRTAQLNQKYYRCRLNDERRLSFWLDLAIAFTSSGAVAGWTIWKLGPGAFVWQIAGAVTTLLAIARPLLKLPERVERLTELATGYSTIAFDLSLHANRARVKGGFSDDEWATIEGIIERNRDLNIKDEHPPRERLHRRCYTEVNRESPVAQLWWGPPTTEGEVK